MRYARQAADRLRRGMAFLLAMALLLGLAPAYLPTAQAAEGEENSWVQGYLEKLVDWGVMRGDQEGNLDPDRDITRAEFVSMINRAYNYRLPGPTPFTDVDLRSWYYDDIGIAYLAGYFYGSSATTASPESTMTREEAAVILARNMMLREEAGEPVDFTDTRELSDWSRSIISSAAQSGVIKGYPDGSFRPQQNITRGEVASMLVNAIGTYVNEEGDYSLGGVYGNLSISSPGVVLRNTTVAGDLYLTSGVGLGDVTLENVTVLGKIVASGAGESHEGDCSIVLRNVTADEMVVDSAANQFVTIRAEGDTNIGLTSVRTHGYIEDATPIGLGLKRIELDGEAGTTLELVGNINEAVNLTPMSTMSLNKGSAEVLTVDELAAGSTLNILNGADAKKVNLDTGTQVTGNGDIADIQINSAGSSVAMLPDKVVIRPGLSGDVAGETMDTVAAQESSQDPKILAGYPSVKNISPKEADAVFSTNKRATLYWAVSAVADGSVSADDLISPPAYGGQIIQKGTLPIDSSKKEVTTKITGLTSDGTYYLSAVIVDNRGLRSPVKVTSFTTPDDSVPAFADGYPVMSKITGDSAQVTIMPTKSCQLFYALLPKNAAAPKPQDFKANAVTGNLGFGSLDVVKNTTSSFYVNSQLLEELQSYDLYLWLTDYNGVKSSDVKKISFTTVDVTPPVILHMDETKMQATSIEMTYSINEPGDLYWVVVKEGEDYPKPLTGQTVKPDLASEAAKLQVANGMNGLKSGNSKASKANTDVKFTISGLEAQTAYDMYYVAKDAAGNYSTEVQKITIHTLDNIPPTVTQEFTRYNGDASTIPLANTDIRLVFSESVQGVDTVQGERVYDIFADLYQDVQKSSGAAQAEAKRILGTALSKYIEMYNVPVTGRPELVNERTEENEDTIGDDWVVDYRNATITREDGKMIITLPTDRNRSSYSALNLASGSTYYFTLAGIADTSPAVNLMGNKTLDRFTTVFAQVNISSADEWEMTVGGERIPIDMSFQLDPMSTSSAAKSTFYDLMIWSDRSMEFELYYRTGTSGAWTKEPNTFVYTLQEDGSLVYRTLAQIQRGTEIDFPFKTLDSLKEGTAYQYAIHVTKLGGDSDRASWNKTVNMQVTMAAGPQSLLRLVTGGSTDASWQHALTSGVVSIGNPDPFKQQVAFTDTRPPDIVSPYPKFEAGDTITDMTFLLNRTGTIYYVVTPIREIKDADGKTTIEIDTPVPATKVGGGTPLPDEVPEDGLDQAKQLQLDAPTKDTIINGNITDTRVRQGNIAGSAASTCTVHLTDLEPETMYYVYLMFQGTTQVVSEKALCYRFTTEKIVRPILNLQLSGTSNVNVNVDRTSEVYGKLMIEANAGSPFMDQFATTANIDPKFVNGSTFKDIPPAYLDKDYTVLQAMIDTYAPTGSSVFDQFASEALKNQVAAFIRGSNNDPATVVDTWHNANVEMNRDELLSFKNMTPGTWYVFIAVAKSPLGSGDAFRAVRPVQLMDQQNPQITSVGGVYYTSSGALRGKLVVVFDEPLYLSILDAGLQVRRPLAVVTGKKRIPDNAIGSAVEYWGVDGRFTFTDTNIKLETETISGTAKPSMTDRFVFDFSAGVRNGAQITFPTGLCDQWGNGANNQAACTLTIRYDTTKEEFVYTISPSVWDGRQK